MIRLKGVTINLDTVTHIDTSVATWTFHFISGHAQLLTPAQQAELDAVYQFDDNSGRLVFTDSVETIETEDAEETEQPEETEQTQGSGEPAAVQQ